MPKLPPAFTLLMSPSLRLIAFCSEWKKMFISKTFKSLPVTSNPRFASTCLHVLTLYALQYSKKHSADSDELKCLEAKHTEGCFVLSPAIMAVTSKRTEADAPKEEGKVCFDFQHFVPMYKRCFEHFPSSYTQSDCSHLCRDIYSCCYSTVTTHRYTLLLE